MIRHRWLRRVVLVGVVLFSVAGLLAGSWRAVYAGGATAGVAPASATDAEQRDIIVLLDNSGTMMRGGVPLDPDEQRIEFTRFLVRALQVVGSPNDHIGVAVFARKVPGIAPTGVIARAALTPVSQWSQHDVARIVPERCPRRGETVFLSDGDFCYGTNYTAALDWAASEFARTEPKCGEGRTCEILIFTDGKLLGDKWSDTYDKSYDFESSTLTTTYSAFADQRHLDPSRLQGLADFEARLRTLAKDHIQLAVGMFLDADQATACTDCWETWDLQQVLQLATYCHLSADNGPRVLTHMGHGFSPKVVQWAFTQSGPRVT